MIQMWVRNIKTIQVTSWYLTGPQLEVGGCWQSVSTTEAILTEVSHQIEWKNVNYFKITLLQIIELPSEFGGKNHVVATITFHTGHQSCLLGKNMIIFQRMIIKVQFNNQNDSLQKPITFNISSSLMLNRKFHQSTFLKSQWVGKSTRDILNFKLGSFTFYMISSSLLVLVMRST